MRFKSCFKVYRIGSIFKTILYPFWYLSFRELSRLFDWPVLVLSLRRFRSSIFVWDCSESLNCLVAIFYRHKCLLSLLVYHEGIFALLPSTVTITCENIRYEVSQIVEWITLNQTNKQIKQTLYSLPLGKLRISPNSKTKIK